MVYTCSRSATYATRGVLLNVRDEIQSLALQFVCHAYGLVELSTAPLDQFTSRLIRPGAKLQTYFRRPTLSRGT